MLTHSLRALGLLGLVVAATAASAQTMPTPSKTPVKANRPAQRPATPPAKPTTNDAVSGYASPGEPVNVQDNGRSTPSYDGPAAAELHPKAAKPAPSKPAAQ